jgi:hypothetical protein
MQQKRKKPQVIIDQLSKDPDGLKLISKIDPTYYRYGKIEVADFIWDKKLNYFEGNAIKYIVRHRMKNGKEDLLKAIWYISRLIESEYNEEPK